MIMEPHMCRLLEDIGLEGEWLEDTMAQTADFICRVDEDVVRTRFEEPTIADGIEYWQKATLYLETNRIGYNRLTIDLSQLPEIAIAGVVYAYTRL